MAGTPPPVGGFAIPRLPSPSGSRARHSINNSFSFGPQSLVDSLAAANTSGASNNRQSYLDPSRSILQTSPRHSSPRLPRRTKTNASRHPLANDTTDVFQDDADDEDDEEGHEWGIVDRMRLWRHDALMQHLYDSAAFWGDKIVSWTNDPNDAFWLAQTYFLKHEYSRAERLLTRPFPTTPPRTGPLASVAKGTFQPPFAPANVKGKGREMPPPTTGGFPDAGELAPGVQRLPMGPGEMIDVAIQYEDGVSRLVDMSVACRYLAAQCQMRQGKWSDALEMLGESNPFRNSGKGGPDAPNMDGGIKIEASMCNLRGLLMLKLNRGDQAKNSFMEALALDVKCYEAFEQLVDGEMMTPEEEWEFVQNLAYREQTPADAEFMKLMYLSRLRKYKHTDDQAIVRRKLVDEWGLGDNPDVLYSFADALYTQLRWADCYAVTSRILSLVSIHKATIPLHVACMYHIKHLNSKLFLFAHDLVEKEPESATSWFAVGMWYMCVEKFPEARTYFSKTSLMDPRFAPAWIAFAHAFSMEGEHDHAVTAYSTCARLYTGSHLPLMFVGMEHMILSNLKLAEEALLAAHHMCDSDPLLYNERGVMAFMNEDYDNAVRFFAEALELADVVQTSQVAWIPTFINFGTALRRIGRLDDARDAYLRVLLIDYRHVAALSFVGLTEHLLGNLGEAIVRYHEALSIDPINGYVLELLELALESSADMGVFGVLGPAPGSEASWEQKMREHRDAKGKQVAQTAVAGDDEMSL
ncbi:TPR-like protein [Trametes versicolor FP-101664 SS1]|uniref:TPR-like protein n=1 Tax=Trametes versicolor (strain FP-101664) TaxID=717944 RepID=UPI00046217FB|nr:TPR-like protein [Trametes versicolor FP-101664 SS1]EIW57715.1 TPR-like protein [Trametes versicolor FP-101664 SS1]